MHKDQSDAEKVQPKAKLTSGEEKYRAKQQRRVYLMSDRPREMYFNVIEACRISIDKSLAQKKPHLSFHIFHETVVISFYVCLALDHGQAPFSAGCHRADLHGEGPQPGYF